MAMLTSSGSADYGLFDELAEEFAERYRRGERPSLQEYVDRCPEMADEIRELFPALVEVEQAEEVLEPQREPAASPCRSSRWGRTVTRIKAEEPDRPRLLDSRIPRDLETIVLKAIDKDLERRHGRGPAAMPGRRDGVGRADDGPVALRPICDSPRSSDATIARPANSSAFCWQ